MRILTAKPGKDGPTLEVGPEFCLATLFPGCKSAEHITTTTPPSKLTVISEEAIHPDVDRITKHRSRVVNLIDRRLLHCLVEDFHGERRGVTWNELATRSGLKPVSVPMKRQYLRRLVSEAESTNNPFAKQFEIIGISGGGLKLVERQANSLDPDARSRKRG